MRLPPFLVPPFDRSPDRRPVQPAAARPVPRTARGDRQRGLHPGVRARGSVATHPMDWRIGRATNRRRERHRGSRQLRRPSRLRRPPPIRQVPAVFVGAAPSATAASAATMTTAAATPKLNPTRLSTARLRSRRSSTNVAPNPRPCNTPSTAITAGSRAVVDGRSHASTAHTDTASRLTDVAATTERLDRSMTPSPVSHSVMSAPPPNAPSTTASASERRQLSTVPDPGILAAVRAAQPVPSGPRRTTRAPPRRGRRRFRGHAPRPAA